MSSKSDSLSEAEVIRFWEMWSEEYWAAKVLRPTAVNVAQFKAWLEFAEVEGGEDIGECSVTEQDEAMDLLIDLFHKTEG